MLFSIITPSYRQLDWLRLCAASVADQNVDVEHLVQDAGSPGIEAWAHSHPRVKVTVEADDGMYDAINRGLRKAQGEICAYLNCDEQYLPGTLQKVGDYFRRNPSVDVLFGDAILADANLHPLAYRRTVTPLRWHTLLRPLGVLTCSTFFRRKIVDDGVLFDPSWRIVGDKAWILEILNQGYLTSVVPEPLSVFAFTGANLSHQQAIHDEKRRWEKNFSPGFRFLRPLAQLHHGCRKWRAGAYHTFTDSLRYYHWNNPSTRTTFDHLQLGSAWPGKPAAHPSKHAP